MCLIIFRNLFMIYSEGAHAAEGCYKSISKECTCKILVNEEATGSVCALFLPHSVKKQ